MGLPPGSRLGPYEIAAPLGIGEVGEVYRARDTRLGRVAVIRVMPSGPAATPETRAQFERGARATLHLKHPNILAVYDVAHEGGFDYVAMELVMGGSLGERLARGPLPLDQALSLGIGIADALDAAHSRGIVHGSLRPEVVLLTDQGQAKVTDFGVAEGWAGYCSSPEHSRGDEVDVRTDLFSLGAVLYEIATGRRAFEGSSAAAVVEAILNREPVPVSSLKPGTPPELDRIIAKALEKDRELRYQTAADIRSDLMRLQRELASPRAAEAGAAGDPGSRARTAQVRSLSEPGARRRRLVRIAWAAGVAVALTAVIILVLCFIIPPSPPPTPARLTLETPREVVSVVGGSMRASPDGRYVAFTASDSMGVNQIWVQPMDGSKARPLEGTEGAKTPFWSPDSRNIGFWADNRVKRIGLAGGQAVTICDATYPGNGSWGSAGTILIGGDPAIAAVSASGGQVTQATWGDLSRGEDEGSPCFPQFLPDGRHFLYRGVISGRPDSTAVRVGCLGSRESRILAVGDFSRVEYVPPGYILYQRGRTLFAQPFDAGRLRLSGDAFPVLDDVVREYPNGDADYSASANGTIVYRDELAVGGQRLAWLDRHGKVTGTLGPVGPYEFGIALSPDGTRVAVSTVGPGESCPDIWVLDLAQNLGTRLTSDPGIDRGPAWSPDGATVFFTDMTPFHVLEVWMRSASGIGDARRLPVPPASVQCVTPDGRFLLARRYESTDIFKLALGGRPDTSILAIQGNLLELSRDGKWLAYQSAETGRPEIYVVDFPRLTNRWRVSSDGGGRPRWSADGRELYFIAPGPMLLSAPISTIPSFRIGRPSRVYEGAPELRDYTPTSDRNRFLVLVDARGERLPPARVVINWLSAIRGR